MAASISFNLADFLKPRAGLLTGPFLFLREAHLVRRQPRNFFFELEFLFLELGHFLDVIGRVLHRVFDCIRQSLVLLPKFFDVRT